MGKAVVAAIIVGTIVSAIVTMSFAFPDTLNQYTSQISQLAPENQKNEVTPEEKESTKKPEQRTEKLSAKISLDSVDPYYLTSTQREGFVIKKTQDGSKCAIDFPGGQRNINLALPYRLEWSALNDMQEEISPCPFYEKGTATPISTIPLHSAKIIKSSKCLSDNAPTDLKLKVDPKCKVTYEQGYCFSNFNNFDWTSKRVDATSIKAIFKDMFGWPHDVKFTVRNATWSDSKSFKNTSEATWVFTRNISPVSVYIVDLTLESSPFIRLTLPNTVEQLHSDKDDGRWCGI